MYSPLLVSTLLLCGAVLSAAEGDIEELTEEIKDFTEKNPAGFILFYYGDWDLNVLPAYENAVSQLRWTSPTIKFAKFNIKLQEQLCINLGVYERGYKKSSLFGFKNMTSLGVKKDVIVGDWTAEAMVKWMESKINLLLEQCLINN